MGTTPETDLDLIATLWPTARAAAHVRPDACILTTRVAIDWLARRGIAARPLVCHALVGNALVRHIYETEGRIATPGEAGALAVTVGFPDEDDGDRPPAYPAHLVALVDDDRYLLDLSIDRANWPEYGIVVHPFWSDLSVPEREALLAGEGWIAGSQDNCVVFYTGHTADAWDVPPYEQTRGWTDDWLREQALAALMALERGATATQRSARPARRRTRAASRTAKE